MSAAWPVRNSQPGPTWNFSAPYRAVGRTSSGAMNVTPWGVGSGSGTAGASGPPVIDLPPQEHGVVLVHGVVAVLHEHAAPVPELHGDGDRPARAEAVDVLAALLSGRDIAGLPVPGEDLALLEVVAEQDGLPVPALDQLGRDGPIEGPDRQGRLGRHLGVELQRDGRARVDAGVEARWDPRVVDSVGLGPLLGGLHGHLAGVVAPPLVRPVLWFVGLVALKLGQGRSTVILSTYFTHSYPK